MAESNASVAELEAEFAAAHQDGMKALDDRDYEGLGVAIQREQAVIDKMGRLLGLAPTSGDGVRAGPIHTQTDRE